jgi:hypothetical protein
MNGTGFRAAGCSSAIAEVATTVTKGNLLRSIQSKPTAKSQSLRTTSRELGLTTDLNAEQDGQTRLATSSAPSPPI